jgi:hypothetical protein
MFVELRHQSHAIFPDDPSRFVAVFVIFESVINGESCHPDVNAGLQWIAFGISCKMEGCFAAASRSRIT